MRHSCVGIHGEREGPAFLAVCLLSGSERSSHGPERCTAWSLARLRGS